MPRRLGLGPLVLFVGLVVASQVGCNWNDEEAGLLPPRARRPGTAPLDTPSDAGVVLDEDVAPILVMPMDGGGDGSSAPSDASGSGADGAVGGAVVDGGNAGDGASDGGVNTPSFRCNGRKAVNVASVCSGQGASTSITMVNGCYDERIRILWMAPTVAGNVCPEQRYAELGPGESVQFQTKVGHRWMVRSAVDGRALGDVTVPSGTAVTVAVP